MSTIKTTNITHGSNSGTANMVLASDGKVTIPEKKLASPGTIIQVLQDTKTDVASITAQTWVDLSGLSIAITPTATSSKILVSWHISAGSSGGEWALRLRRDSTDIYKGDAATDLTQVTDAFYGGSDTGDGYYGLSSRNGQYLDSPSSTSAITYGFQWSNMSTSGTVYVNRGSYDSGIYGPRGASSITVMEISG